MVTKIYVVMKRGQTRFAESFMCEAWPTKKQAVKRAALRNSSARSYTYFVEAVHMFSGCTDNV